MKPVLIFGAGQVASVVREMLGDSAWFGEYARFVVDAAYAPQDVKFVTTTEIEHLRFPQTFNFVIGMSFKGLNQPRAQKFAWMRGLGYEPLTWRAPDSWLPRTARLGDGTFVMDRNTIQSDVAIGENCMLWSGNHIGHHSKIGDHVWLSSGIVVSGACEIGDYTFVGSGATIADNVKIGKRCIIGAGSLVLQDVPDDSVVAERGTPTSKVSSARAARLLG